METTLILSQIIAEKDDLSVFFTDVDTFRSFCAELYVKRGQVISTEELQYLNEQGKAIAEKAHEQANDGTPFMHVIWKEDDLRKEAARLALIELA